MEKIKNFIGVCVKNILLERYFHNNIPMDVIRIYIYDGDTYYGVVCAEGNVVVNATGDFPKSICDDEYKYQIETLTEDWIGECRISSVSYICSSEGRNGIALFLDNGHNLVFYNTNYEEGDNDIFETDADISKLKEKYTLHTFE